MSRRLLITLLFAVFAALLFPVPAHAASRQEPTCPSLEGCYSYDQMQAFYDQVILMIDSFSSAEYQGDMRHPEYWYAGSDELLTTRCDGDADGLAFAYCSADRTVYVGQDQLWDFYRMSGDGAAAFAVAHEWGHHVQHTVGVYDLFVDDQASYIEAENQADCIGGAFLAHLRDRGILEQDDYADVGAVLPKIASAESDVYRDHGTVEERVEATRYGLANGLEGCSEYFPAAASLI
jgi:predicted metalloprotease